MAVDSSAKYTGPILVPTGQYAGRPGIQLRRPVYLIGARSDARIHLQSSTVSRVHALVVQTRHETYIRDLASRTHLFVNGKQVGEAVLKHGDLLAIGKFTFQYQLDHKPHGSEPAVPPATLQVVGADMPIPIEGRTLLIGRRVGCDIRLTEESASSAHALILQWEGLRFIRDLGTRTGTFVNGQQVHEVQLNPNDAIRIGETDITYAPSLEEAAFDLITDASDSLIADTPVAEEINIAPEEEPVAEVAPIQPIEPFEPIEPIVTAPAAARLASHEPLPLEDIAATSEPVEELSPLAIEDALLSPEEPAAPIAAKESVAPQSPPPPVPQSSPPPTAPPLSPQPFQSSPIPLADVVVDVGEPKSDETDLVTLATDDAELMSMESAPHDTAHIPLALSSTQSTAEAPIEAVAVPPAQNAVVDASLQSPVGSIDIAAAPEPLSAEDVPQAESLSNEVPVAETIPQQGDVVTDLSSAVTDDSANVEADGLELLDESGIPPFTPSSPEPFAADVGDAIDDTDLPRRGWRSGIAEPAVPISSPLVAEAEAPVAEQNRSEEPAAEAELAAPQLIEMDAAEPPVVEGTVAESQIDEPSAVESALSEPEAAALEFAAPEFTESKVAEPEATIMEAATRKVAATEFPATDITETQPTDDVLQFADEQTSTEEPIASGDAVIDLSALSSIEDFSEPLDVADSEPAESNEPAAQPATDLGLAVESVEPVVAEPFDLSSVDFAAPEKTIAHLANEAPVLQATETPTDVVAEVPAEKRADQQAPEPIAEALPPENIPDEFIPSGENSPNDLPVDDGESLSSFKARRQQTRDKASRIRRPRNETIAAEPTAAESIPTDSLPAEPSATEPTLAETIEATDPTPQSALDLPAIESAMSEVPATEANGGPVLPLVELAADLSDTTFGRAVQEFEGESTGPIVEEAKHADHEQHKEHENQEDHEQSEASGSTAAIEPVTFAESPEETVAPNFHDEKSESPEVADEETTVSDSLDMPDVPAAHVPLFDASTVEDSIPFDLAPVPHSAVQRPLELPRTDFVGVDNTFVVPEESDAPPPRISNTLDLSKLQADSESVPLLDESVVSDILSEPPMHSGHAITDVTTDATTDAHIDLAPPEVTHSANDPTDAAIEPAAELPSESAHIQPEDVEPQPFEPPHAKLPTEPSLVETGIDVADLEDLGANQTHYLGGEPLNLKEGVHPPQGFGEVSVDFSQPPAVRMESPAALHHEEPNQEESVPAESVHEKSVHEEPQPQSAPPADHDILPPEAGDAIVPAAPAALSSLTALAEDVSAAGMTAAGMAAGALGAQFAADPFATDLAATKIEIPPFGSTTPPEQEPPAMRIESDAPLRSVGKGKGRKSRVIRNGFGQNPDSPKATPIEIPPFADSAPGLAGMAIDSLAMPAVKDADVFSELPLRSEAPAKEDPAKQPRGVNEAGSGMTGEMSREMTGDIPGDMAVDAWVKSSPLPGRSRRRSAVKPSISSDIASESLASPVGLTGMGAEYLQPRPAILLEDENRANAAAERRTRLLKRVPILCATMVALIGVAVTICVLFIPVRQQVQATMSYRNFDSLTHEEQLRFEANQDRKLHLDSTRMLAITKLQNRHPETAAGFLMSPERFGSLTLDWPETRAGEPGIAWINFDSTDKNSDPARVQAVAMAMFDVNSDLATAAQATKQSRDKLSSDIAADGRQIDEFTNKINAERAFLDGRPTLAELAKVKDDDATLEAAYKDAMDKAMTAQAAVDQLNKEHKAETTPAAPGTDPVAADAQIQQMSKDADALNARIAAARKERADLASKARATLDSAYDQFKKQVEGSQNVTKDNPQLAAYVTAAQNLQQAIHQLTDQYIQKQQDEYNQLNQMKSSFVAKIQQRQAELFADDPQLKELNDKKEILTRQYNEAVNSGLDQDASDKKNELTLIDTATKARQEIISNDPFYTGLLNDLQNFIDQKQHNIDEQRKSTDEQLASMKTAFEKSAPTVEQLPAEQKQLAAAMQDRLAQIDAARKQYAEAADASAGDTDSDIQKMVNDLQTMQTNIETRKRQVAAANSDAARKERDDQFAADLSQKTAQLDQLNKTATTAQAAYQANHAKMLQKESVADQTGASAQRLEQDINNQQAMRAQLEQHKMAWDQKQAEADSAVEPLEPEALAHLVGAPIDNRVLYAAISSGSIVLAFLIAICWTVISAARESHHAYVPAFESLETPGPHKANGNGAMHHPDAEENQAAVA